jgi:hypothetical protein
MVGWIDHAFTNVPSRQEHEHVIDRCWSTDRRELRCLARPRFSSSLGRATRAGDLAGKLREAFAGEWATARNSESRTPSGRWDNQACPRRAPVKASTR